MAIPINKNNIGRLFINKRRGNQLERHYGITHTLRLAQDIMDFYEVFLQNKFKCKRYGIMRFAIDPKNVSPQSASKIQIMRNHFTFNDTEGWKKYEPFRLDFYYAFHLDGAIHCPFFEWYVDEAILFQSFAFFAEDGKRITWSEHIGKTPRKSNYSD